MNRFGVTDDHYAHVMYGRSGTPGTFHYLLQCGVKMPESVVQQMSSAEPTGSARPMNQVQWTSRSTPTFLRILRDVADEYSLSITDEQLIVLATIVRLHG